LYNIDKKNKMTFDETSEMVIKDTEMTQISQKHSFQEKELYHIFLGKNDSDEDLIASVHLPEKIKEITKKYIQIYKSNDYKKNKKRKNKEKKKVINENTSKLNKN